MNERQDDGSLAFLQIPRDENSRSFNCDETTQSKLVNTEFWVVDFIEEVPQPSSTNGNRRLTRKSINRLSRLGWVGRSTATANIFYEP